MATFFNKWRLISLNCGVPVEYVDPSMNQKVLKSFWQQKRQTETKQKRYPAGKLNKKQWQFETERFDLEREFHYKKKTLLLFNSIFRNQRRRLKVLYVSAYYKFVANSLLIERNEEIYNKWQISMMEPE